MCSPLLPFSTRNFLKSSYQTNQIKNKNFLATIHTQTSPIKFGVKRYDDNLNRFPIAPSCLFFSNVEVQLEGLILDAFKFEKGQLPIRYLGVPLITSKLKKQDCDTLVNAICTRINSWKSKFLSYAG